MVPRGAQAPRAPRAPVAARRASTRPTCSATAPSRRAPPAPTTCAPTRPPASALTRRVREALVTLTGLLPCAQLAAHLPCLSCYCLISAEAGLHRVQRPRSALRSGCQPLWCATCSCHQMPLCKPTVAAAAVPSAGCGAHCKHACTLRVCMMSHQSACSIKGHDHCCASEVVVLRCSVGRGGRLQDCEHWRVREQQWRASACGERSALALQAVHPSALVGMGCPTPIFAGQRSMARAAYFTRCCSGEPGLIQNYRLC